MKIDNRPDTVTITLTRAEANTLRVELMDLDPARVSNRALIQGLIDETKDPAVSKEVAADAILRVAQKYRKSKACAAFPDDAEDLEIIADLVRKGKYATARRATAYLDTAVRDEIPECAYPYVGLRSLR